MSKLTNTELQAAIECTLKHDTNMPEEHLDALLAEQIRRLNDTEDDPVVEGGDITDNGDGTVDVSAGTGWITGDGTEGDAKYEYVVAFVNDANDVRRSSGTVSGMLHECSVYEASRMNAIRHSRTPYGAYQRRVDVEPVSHWFLITNDLGVLPNIVAEII